MMADMELSVAEFGLGEEAKEFLASNLGRVLIGRVKNDIEIYRDELEAGEGPMTKIRIQLQARRTLIQYLDDVVQNGDIARTNIDRYETEIFDDE